MTNKLLSPEQQQIAHDIAEKMFRETRNIARSTQDTKLRSRHGDTRLAGIYVMRAFELVACRRQFVSMCKAIPELLGPAAGVRYAYGFPATGH